MEKKWAIIKVGLYHPVPSVLFASWANQCVSLCINYYAPNGYPVFAHMHTYVRTIEILHLHIFSSYSKLLKEIISCRGEMRRAWQPTPVFLPGESHGQRSLEGYSPWGRKELDTTERPAHYKMLENIISCCNHIRQNSNSLNHTKSSFSLVKCRQLLSILYISS